VTLYMNEQHLTSHQLLSCTSLTKKKEDYLKLKVDNNAITL
jgi:hypothetical protein